MKALAFVALCTGCSFATATIANHDPAKNCSFTPGYADLITAAAAGVFTIVMAAKVHSYECSQFDTPATSGPRWAPGSAD